MRIGRRILRNGRFRSRRLSHTRRRRLLYALTIVLVVFIALESASRLREIWYPPIPYDPAAGFSPQRSFFVPCRDQPGQLCTHPNVRDLTFVSQSFAPRAPDGTLRIVAIGGSSVRGLQQEFDALRTRLVTGTVDSPRVEIINCGGGSYGSTRLAIVAREMRDYEPDLFLVYSGHNEFEDLHQQRQTPRWTTGVQRPLGRSAFYRLLRDLALLGKARWQLRHVPYHRQDLGGPDVEAAWDHTFTPQEVQVRTDVFRSNLTSIIEDGLDVGAGVILGTVPSNLWSPLVVGWEDEYGRVLAAYRSERYDEGSQLVRSALSVNTRHQASPAENQVIRELANAYRLPLADVESAVEAAEPNGVAGETLFDDHCHLNENGNRILIETFEAEIRAWLAAKSDDSAGILP